MKPSVFLTFFFLAITHCCSAQLKGFKFQNFTQEDGLPSNESYFVYRDSRNYLWMATDQGVVRYNGSKMEHFNLPDNVIFKIREDDKGRVWFFSHSGKLAYFFKEKIYPYKYNDSILVRIKNILITDAYVNKNDEIFITTARNSNYKISSSGIIKEDVYFWKNAADTTQINITRINKDHFFSSRSMYNPFSDHLKIQLNSGDDAPQKNYVVSTLVENYNHTGVIYNGHYFLFAGKMLMRLNPDGTIKSRTFSADILCMQAFGKNIWIGTIKNGAFLLNEELEMVEKEPVLNGISITSVAADYEGGSWFSSLEKGVYYLKNMHIYDLKGDLAITQPVSRMHGVGDSVLLFSNEQGIYKLEKDAVSALLPLKNDNIADIISWNNKIIVGGKFRQNDMSANAYQRIKLNGSPVKEILLKQSSSELAVTSDNKLYNMVGDLIQYVNLGETVSPTRYQIGSFYYNDMGFSGTFFYLDSAHKGWVGSTSNIYHPSPSYDTVFPVKPSNPYFQKGVTGMRQMPGGIYAFAIRFGGIVLMKNNEVLANITDKEGLYGNSVKYMMPWNNQLWVATNLGISVISFSSWSPLKYTINNIGKNEGLNNLIIKQLITYQGNVLAATSNGIYVIEKPAQFTSYERLPIPLYINTVNYYKGDTGNISAINVPYNDNRLKISLNAVCFNSAAEVQYFYRFDKGDSSWQTISGTELLLENLSPGIYNLQLKAGIPNQQRSSAIIDFAITIEEPWWQNAWLKVAVVLSLIFAGVLFYKYRIRIITRKARRQTELQTRMLELEQTALRSQMNPHFIFNSLTSIQQLIVNNKSVAANDHLVKFARLIRKTLELSARPYIKLSEEKDYLSEYLYLEQLRIPGEFEYSIKIDESIDVDHTEIPNMMLQPIVENCIRHGIKHLEDRKGIITVTMTRNDEFVTCTVTDNGIGRSHTELKRPDLLLKQKSYGMDIVRKRLELQPGKDKNNLTLEIKDLFYPDGTASGTEVTIQLPFKITSQ